MLNASKWPLRVRRPHNAWGPQGRRSSRSSAPTPTSSYAARPGIRPRRPSPPRRGGCGRNACHRWGGRLGGRDHSVGKSRGRSVAQPRGPAVGRAVKRAVGRSGGRAHDRAGGCAFARSVSRAGARSGVLGPAGGRVVGRSTGRAVGRSVGLSRSVGLAGQRAIARSVGRAIERSAGRGRVGRAVGKTSAKFDRKPTKVQHRAYRSHRPKPLPTEVAPEVGAVHIRPKSPNFDRTLDEVARTRAEFCRICAKFCQSPKYGRIVAKTPKSFKVGGVMPDQLRPQVSPFRPISSRARSSNGRGIGPLHPNSRCVGKTGPSSTCNSCALRRFNCGLWWVLGLGHVWPRKLAKLYRTRLPNLADFDQVWSGSILPKLIFGQIRPNLGQVRPSSIKCGLHPTNFGQAYARSGQFWSSFGQSWPHSVELGRKWTTQGQTRPKLVKLTPTLARHSKCDKCGRFRPKFGKKHRQTGFGETSGA